MKDGIHPKMHSVTAKCACGVSFETTSTKNSTLSVENCSKCHSFFTGNTKIDARGGRVDRFNQILAKKKA